MTLRIDPERNEVHALKGMADWRGKRVLGLERFDIPHAMGSSHGINRIIRLAYMEHPSYVPLLRRAYEVWRELEAAAGERLLFVTGGVDAGPEDGRIVQGALASCREHGLAHEVLTAAELAARFPGWRMPEHFAAVVQPDGGFVASERMSRHPGVYSRVASGSSDAKGS